MTPLQWFRAWADLLDSRFRVPGTDIRFGIDPLLSLVPGVGDLASPVFAVLLLTQAVRQRVPRIVLVRMLLIALVDAIIGAVPIAGTVGDVFFRANLRNLALLERHARPGLPASRADYVFVGVVLAIFGLVVMIPIVLGLWLVFWLLGLGSDPGLTRV